MNEKEPEMDRLRVAFLSDAGQEETCGPDPAEVWDAVAGDLSLEKTRNVVDWAARSPQVAEWWRLAYAVQREMKASVPKNENSSSSFWGRALNPVWAAAAVVVLSLVSWFLIREPAIPTSDTYRTLKSDFIITLVPEDVPINRADATLRWAIDGDGDWVFDIRVWSETMELIATAYNLTKAEYKIPEELLTPLPPEGLVYWRVDGQSAQGDRISSKAFRAILK